MSWLASMAMPWRSHQQEHRGRNQQRAAGQQPSAGGGRQPRRDRGGHGDPDRPGQGDQRRLDRREAEADAQVEHQDQAGDPGQQGQVDAQAGHEGALAEQAERDQRGRRGGSCVAPATNTPSTGTAATMAAKVQVGQPSSRPCTSGYSTSSRPTVMIPTPTGSSRSARGAFDSRTSTARPGGRR